MPKCKSRSITRKGCLKNKTVRIKKGCIKPLRQSDKKRSVKARRKITSRSSNCKQLFALEKGTLTKYGYHADISENDRRQALSRALADGLKPLSLYRKINALYILNKNQNRALAKLYRQDAKWIKDTPEYMAR
jgi:hypothetical protein